MGNVVLAMSMSLDGFVAAPNDRVGQALGDGGQRLHEWISDGRARNLLAEAAGRTGAIVMGRRTFDLSGGPHAWGNAGVHTPCFVLTHRPPRNAHPAFSFVTDGVEAALARAKAAAGGADVAVMGASVGRQCLAAGLLDEMALTLVPVFLGGGIRLFENLGGADTDFAPQRPVETPGVTHLRFRVIR